MPVAVSLPPNPPVPAVVDPVLHGRYQLLTVCGPGQASGDVSVEQFVDGEDLQHTLEDTRYSVREVLEILAELLPILICLRDRSPPVLHRDLKPKNVIREGESGGLFPVDFGAVRDSLTDEDLGGSTVAGTFGFMAPEQFMGNSSPATDLYGLGAIAVALLARKPLHTLLDTDRPLKWGPHIQVSAPVSKRLTALLASEPVQGPFPAGLHGRATALIEGAMPAAQ